MIQKVKPLSILAVLFALIAPTARGFTFDDLLKTSCPERTFVCPFNGWCCESDSQKCSNMSFTCEDVFLKDEDRDKVCCGVLYKNDTTRKGLLSACINRLGSVTWQSHCKDVNGSLTLDDLLEVRCAADSHVCPSSGNCCKTDSQMCNRTTGKCEPVFEDGEDVDQVCCDALEKNDTSREGLLSACWSRLGTMAWQSYCKAVKGSLTLDDLLEVRCAADSHVCPSSGNCCKTDSQMCNITTGKCEPVFEDGEDVDQVCCDALEKNDTSREGLLSACWSRLGTMAWQSYCKGCSTPITISVICTIAAIIILFLIYHFCWKQRTNVQNRNTGAISYQRRENIHKPSETQESQSSAARDEGLPPPVLRGGASQSGSRENEHAVLIDENGDVPPSGSHEDEHDVLTHENGDVPPSGSHEDEHGVLTHENGDAAPPSGSHEDEHDVLIHGNGDVRPSGSHEDEHDVLTHENGEGSVQESSFSVPCQTLDTRDEEPTERDPLLDK